jgi:hypothetical protein
MYPQIVKFDEKNTYYEYFINLIPYVLEGRKEGDGFLKNKYPHLF